MVDSTIFVSRLPQSTRSADLVNHFSLYGKVLTAKILFNNSGKGIVVFHTPADCQAALHEFHVIGNSRLTVRPYNPAPKVQQPDSSRPTTSSAVTNAGKSWGVVEPVMCKTLFIGDLPLIITKREVEEVVADTGYTEIVLPHVSPQATSRYVFVRYPTHKKMEDALNAIKGTLVEDIPIRVGYSILETTD